MIHREWRGRGRTTAGGGRILPTALMPRLSPASDAAAHYLAPHHRARQGDAASTTSVELPWTTALSSRISDEPYDKLDGRACGKQRASSRSLAAEDDNSAAARRSRRRCPRSATGEVDAPPNVQLPHNDPSPTRVDAADFERRRPDPRAGGLPSGEMIRLAPRRPGRSGPASRSRTCRRKAQTCAALNVKMSPTTRHGAAHFFTAALIRCFVAAARAAGPPTAPASADAGAEGEAANALERRQELR